MKGLSEKIESARKDYSELTKKVILDIGTIAMVVVTTIMAEKNSNQTRKGYLEGEHEEYK